MNSKIHIRDDFQQKQFVSLKQKINNQRVKALRKRLKENEFMTDMEYITGAFMEMYEPYLTEVVTRLFDKGYSVDISSGFCGNNFPYQSLNGQFSLDYITRNKLEKEGVRVREFNGFRSLVFFDKNFDLDLIKQKWLQLIELLPDKGKMTSLSTSSRALLFRRKYISNNPQLQKQSEFDHLYFNIQTKIEQDVKKRKKTNPHPTAIESKLGVFIEELEPQVRQAVLEMNKKGYSTDLSGCVKDSSDQMIEGDFQLTEKVVNKLKKSGVKVEINPSGYTRLQFAPHFVDIAKIKKQWNNIVALLPSNNKTAALSMTRKSRAFRMKY